MNEENRIQITCFCRHGHRWDTNTISRQDPRPFDMDCPKCGAGYTCSINNDPNSSVTCHAVPVELSGLTDADRAEAMERYGSSNEAA